MSYLLFGLGILLLSCSLYVIREGPCEAARLRVCTGSSEPSLLIDAISTNISSLTPDPIFPFCIFSSFEGA